MEFSYRVIVNGEETRIKTSEDSLRSIVDSEMFAIFPRGQFRGKPEGHVNINYLRVGAQVKADGRVTESFDRGDVNSFEIYVTDSEKGREVANNAAELFHLPKPFPGYGSLS